MLFEIEQAFSDLDRVTTIIETQEQQPYLDSLILSLRLIQNADTINLSEEDGKDCLKRLREMISVDNVDKESIRKVIQLALIKGMKGSTQHQHVVTPDSVAIFTGYFIEKLLPKEKQFRLFDPASGAANLLTAVMNQVSAEVEGYGSEIDATLIQLAMESANLQKSSVEFFHQDSLAPLLLEPVDVVVSDLPVGYYPDDLQASKYELKADSGHAYAHHLFIEQSLTYTKEGGYLLLLIPNFLFTSDQSEKLQKFLHKHVHILSLLQLPLSMFSSEQHAKSILILQKQGKETKPPKETLMAQLPSFKDVHATQNILRKIDDWFQTESRK